MTKAKKKEGKKIAPNLPRPDKLQGRASERAGENRSQQNSLDIMDPTAGAAASDRQMISARTETRPKLFYARDRAGVLLLRRVKLTVKATPTCRTDGPFKWAVQSDLQTDR